MRKFRWSASAWASWRCTTWRCRSARGGRCWSGLRSVSPGTRCCGSSRAPKPNRSSDMPSSVGDLQVLFVDHLAPSLALGPDVLGKLLRRAGHRLVQLLLHELLLDRQLLDDLADLRVDPHHDVARRAGGGGQSEPGAGDIAGNALG